MNPYQIERWQNVVPLSPGLLSPGGSEPLTAGPLLHTASPGFWICELATETLRWTDEVFDLFGLSRDKRLDRRATVEMYCDRSREEMEWLRAEAIALRRGFTLDAEIQRADGARRLMRLTARVHCRNGLPTHIFGTKQDITFGTNRPE